MDTHEVLHVRLDSNKDYSCRYILSSAPSVAKIEITPFTQFSSLYVLITFLLLSKMKWLMANAKLISSYGLRP